VRHGAALRTHGWRGRRTVALTFDDGPWPDTAAFLRVLERRHVRATFFQVGRQVRGQDRLERRILRDGDAIGNHTLNHPSLPAVPARVGQELSLTSAIIHHTSGGYRPCLFRPPYGAYNSAIVQRARADGMTTVIWDVDPRDWSRPGSRAIESRVMAQVRSGSIVLMHDGGGPREQTLSALPRIIGDLRRRGYGLVTVPELLGYRTRHG
jgi:peptidoglycan/xylan/chitin deacetylase (PgdA/CDA1 family)